jgi:hypothetical protein
MSADALEMTILPNRFQSFFVVASSKKSKKWFTSKGARNSCQMRLCCHESSAAAPLAQRLFDLLLQAVVDAIEKEDYATH